MRYLIAIFFPWISFFTIKRPYAAIVCLLIPVVSWIFCIYSFFVISLFAVPLIWFVFIVEWPLTIVWAILSINKYESYVEQKKQYDQRVFNLELISAVSKESLDNSKLQQLTEPQLPKNNDRLILGIFSVIIVLSIIVFIIVASISLTKFRAEANTVHTTHNDLAVESHDNSTTTVIRQNSTTTVSSISKTTTDQVNTKKQKASKNTSIKKTHSNKEQYLQRDNLISIISVYQVSPGSFTVVYMENGQPPKTLITKRQPSSDSISKAELIKLQSR